MSFNINAFNIGDIVHLKETDGKILPKMSLEIVLKKSDTDFLCKLLPPYAGKNLGHNAEDFDTNDYWWTWDNNIVLVKILTEEDSKAQKLQRICDKIKYLDDRFKRKQQVKKYIFQKTEELGTITDTRIITTTTNIEPIWSNSGRGRVLSNV